MSHIALTDAERIQALERFGYNRREASFLCRAALHSGYFLRRQYGAFVGGRDGGSVTQLIDKALDCRHVQVATYRANIHVYHLAARPFYAALGQEDNRNRRPKEPSTIKAKLMGLDFVLGNPDWQYLATEQEKVDYFVGDLALETSLLPTKRYASNGQTTARHFVEKYPLFLSPSARPASPPVVSFCFVDEGSVGVSGFSTFLVQYGGLLRRLRESQVVYIAATATHFDSAAKVFERFSNGFAEEKGSATFDSFRLRMLAHFEARLHYEKNEWDSFDRVKLLRLRDERAEFSGPQIESLFERWKAGGRSAILQASGQSEPTPTLISSQFSTYLLEHSYDLFGNLTAF